jgi:hypothetical protein
MPKYLDFADFSNTLKRPSFNRNEAKKFLADYPRDYVVDGIDLPENFQLKSNKKQTVIRLLDRKDRENLQIAYAVDIELTDEKINQKSCTQILVWKRAGSEELLRGFAKKLFNHFLQKYVVMITDELQTSDGKRFWENRIVEAFVENKFVYFLDKNSVDKKLQQIESSDDFFETFEPLGWGNDKAHQNKWFVISMTALI